jgi:integrase
MPRKRKSASRLPHRVYVKHGAYYYVPVAPIIDPRSGEKKAWLLLCRVAEGESALYGELSKILSDRSQLEGTMPYACAEFKARKLGDYEQETKDTYGRYLDAIAGAFEDFHCSQVTTKDCADFIRAKYADKANSARKVAALMRKLFRYIIGELGLRQDNPLDQIDLGDYKPKGRKHVPTHAQIVAIRAAGMVSKKSKKDGTQFATASGPMFACIIDMTYLLWARAIDIRKLKEAQIAGDQPAQMIRIKPTKTQRTSGLMVDIEVTAEIAAVIERARAIKRKYGVISPYLFPSKKGTPYSKNGLISMWNRAKDRAGIADDVVFKDIRALAATDAAKRGTLREEIKRRLVHSNIKTTDIYIKEVIAEVSNLDVPLPWASE